LFRIGFFKPRCGFSASKVMSSMYHANLRDVPIETRFEDYRSSIR